MDVTEFERGVRLCAFQYDGRRTGYMCPYREYCCSGGCCPSSSITFYQLWYFWLLLLLVILVCSGSGWWFRWRHSASSISSPVAQAVARRRSQRQRVYPRYHQALDTAPPSYAEVMRRLSEYPQARSLQHGAVGQGDIGWVNSPPPPYEAVNDLRQQETKLDQEIQLEESPCTSRPEREILRRGVSARERRKFSAKQRIKMLLGTSSRERCSRASQPVFAISSGSSAQPVAWSYNTPNMPIMQPLPPLDLLPPYRPASNFPYSLPPPYLHQAMAAPPLYSDVDEWSRNDRNSQTTSATFSRPATAARANFDRLPGEVCEGSSSGQTDVSPEEMEKVFKDIRSPLSPRIENNLPSPDAQTHGNNDTLDHQRSIASFPTSIPSDQEQNQVLPSGSSESIPEQSPALPSASAARASADIIHLNSTPQSNNSFAASAPPLPKYSSRPVSSTALPTPGLAARSSNLPGTTITTENEAVDGSLQCVSARSASGRPRTSGMDSDVNKTNLPVNGGSPAREFSFHARSRAPSVVSELQASPCEVSSDTTNEELSAIPESPNRPLPEVTNSSAVSSRSHSLPTSVALLPGHTTVTNCTSGQSINESDSTTPQIQ